MMKKAVLINIILSLYFSVNAQVNTDSIFNQAIRYSRTQEYTKAIEEAEKVLLYYPQRYDVIVFIANAYAWSGDYNQAQQNIAKAYQINNTNKELYDAWLNILLWSQEYDKLLKTTQLAEENKYPNTYNLTLKKSLAYKGLMEYKEGINYLESQEHYLDSAAIKAIYNQMADLKRDNALSVYYALDLFGDNNPKPQHLAYLDFSFKVKKSTFIPRINYVKRFDLKDYQFDLDYYQIFKNESYFYSNYGIATKADLFPNHKAGFEYYVPLGKGFETSLGTRYMRFGEKNVYTLTTHLSMYTGNFLFSVRPYYVLHDLKNTFSSAYSLRHYGKNPINYTAFEFLYGNSPDDHYALSQAGDIFVLKKYRFKLNKNTALYKSMELNISFSYSNEEYTFDKYRDRFTFEFMLKHKF